MRTRIIALLGLVLILPASLFMTALALRSLQPLQYEPARSAQQLVMWYAGRMWTLWVLLLGLPFIGLVSGCAEILRGGSRDTILPRTSWKLQGKVRARLASRFIATTTMIAGLILAIVVLHVLAN
jgi:hypothetical protein